MHRYFEINEHGHNIRCKIYCRDLKSVQRVVVFGHGFSGHKDNSAAEKFAERMISKYKNSALITFNWPAHGDDVKRNLRLDDCMDYLALVVAHIRQKYSTDEIYAYATSFGGYLFLRYIRERENPFRKIALRCPAVNMHDVLMQSIASEEEQELLKKGKPVLVGFDRKVPVSGELLAELKKKDIQQLDYLDDAENMRIIHGTADEVVPYDVVCAFADNNLIEFVPVEKADHRFRDPKAMDTAIKQILALFGW